MGVDHVAVAIALFDDHGARLALRLDFLAVDDDQVAALTRLRGQRVALGDLDLNNRVGVGLGRGLARLDLNRVDVDHVAVGVTLFNDHGARLAGRGDLVSVDNNQVATLADNELVVAANVDHDDGVVLNHAGQVACLRVLHVQGDLANQLAVVVLQLDVDAASLARLRLNNKLVALALNGDVSLVLNNVEAPALGEGQLVLNVVEDVLVQLLHHYRLCLDGDLDLANHAAVLITVLNDDGAFSALLRGQGPGRTVLVQVGVLRTADDGQILARQAVDLLGVVDLQVAGLNLRLEDGDLVRSDEAILTVTLLNHHNALSILLRNDDPLVAVLGQLNKVAILSDGQLVAGLGIDLQVAQVGNAVGELRSVSILLVPHDVDGVAVDHVAVSVYNLNDRSTIGAFLAGDDQLVAVTGNVDKILALNNPVLPIGVLDGDTAAGAVLQSERVVLDGRGGHRDLVVDLIAVLIRNNNGVGAACALHANDDQLAVALHNADQAVATNHAVGITRFDGDLSLLVGNDLDRAASGDLGLVLNVDHVLRLGAIRVGHDDLDSLAVGARLRGDDDGVALAAPLNPLLTNDLDVGVVLYRDLAGLVVPGLEGPEVGVEVVLLNPGFLLARNNNRGGGRLMRHRRGGGGGLSGRLGRGLSRGLSGRRRIRLRLRVRGDLRGRLRLRGDLQARLVDRDQTLRSLEVHRSGLGVVAGRHQNRDVLVRLHGALDLVVTRSLNKVVVGFKVARLCLLTAINLETGQVLKFAVGQSTLVVVEVLANTVQVTQVVAQQRLENQVQLLYAAIIACFSSLQELLGHVDCSYTDIVVQT